jgi:hypothetical protein
VAKGRLIKDLVFARVRRGARNCFHELQALRSSPGLLQGPILWIGDSSSPLGQPQMNVSVDFPGVTKFTALHLLNAKDAILLVLICTGRDHAQVVVAQTLSYPVHWYVPSSRYTRGLGWRIHCGVEVTESSTNKQQHHHNWTLTATLLIIAESQPALKFRVNRPRPRSQPARAGRACVLVVYFFSRQLGQL